MLVLHRPKIIYCNKNTVLPTEFCNNTKNVVFMRIVRGKVIRYLYYDINIFLLAI